jgi:hypothetical protein
VEKKYHKHFGERSDKSNHAERHLGEKHHTILVMQVAKATTERGHFCERKYHELLVEEATKTTAQRGRGSFVGH